MTSSTITIRPAGADDAAALEDLAGLDSHRTPAAPVLVAEIDGVLQAAISLRDDTVIADPFAHTGEVRSLLAARARQSRETMLPRAA